MFLGMRGRGDVVEMEIRNGTRIFFTVYFFKGAVSSLVCVVGMGKWTKKMVSIGVYVCFTLPARLRNPLLLRTTKTIKGLFCGDYGVLFTAGVGKGRAHVL